MRGWSRGPRLAPGIAVCLLAATAPVAAQGPTPPPYKTLRHDEDYAYLKDRSRAADGLDPLKYIPLSDSRDAMFLTLGGEVRERFEWVRNRDADAANAPDGYLLQRYTLLADVHLGKRYRVFTHLKSALEHGRAPGPRPTDEDRLDVHEMFLELHLSAMAIRLGRQEFAFGSQRLVSIRKGPNVPRSFDGVGMIARPGRWRIDAFATRPAETNPGTFDDGSERDRSFWGLYAVGPLHVVKDASIDLYYLGLDRDAASFEQGTATELRETVGARISRRSGSWDYDVEGVYQWGRFGSGTISAWTVASNTGLTLGSTPWRPRLGLKADVTSGDRDPGDPRLQSFNPLFPRGSYFGENQQIGPINHIDLHPSIHLHPTPKLNISPSWVFFWRESLRDGVYDVAGNLVRAGAGTNARYIGSQPALTLEWEVDRHLTIVVDLECFLAGPFLRETGPADDVVFAASWVTFTF
jgi:Alginate export